MVEKNDEFPTGNQVGVHEIGIRFERAQRQICRRTFYPKNVHPGARYGPTLEFRFRWGRSQWDGNLKVSDLV